MLHLGHWYAQSHPTEDFAETFAVWLPHALALAQPVRGLAGAEASSSTSTRRCVRCRASAPACLSRDVIEPLAENTRTLREHYRRKQRRYEVDTARSYDRRLLRVFGTADEHPGRAAGEPLPARGAAAGARD